MTSLQFPSGNFKRKLLFICGFGVQILMLLRRIRVWQWRGDEKIHKGVYWVQRDLLLRKRKKNPYFTISCWILNLIAEKHNFHKNYNILMYLKIYLLITARVDFFLKDIGGEFKTTSIDVQIIVIYILQLWIESNEKNTKSYHRNISLSIWYHKTFHLG